MATIRDVANDKNYKPSLRAAAASLTAQGFGDVGVRSGVRSKSGNKKAGGATDSRHLHHDALDIAGATGWSNAQREAFTKAAAAAGVKGFGLYNSGAIHIDTRPGNPSFWGVSGPGNRKGHSRNNKKNFNEFPAWARPVFAAVAKGTAYTPRPQIDVPNVAVAQAPDPSVAQAAAAWQAAPALSPQSPAVSPSASLSSFAPSVSPSQGALAAIDRVAPTRPSESIVGQYADMSRYAPQAPAAPAGPMADASYNSPFGALGIQAAPRADQAPTPTRTGLTDDDDAFGFDMARSVMPGGIMSPTGALGGQGLYAKAQDPSTFAGALNAPAAQPAAPAAAAPPSGLAPALTPAYDIATAPQTATPMGLAPPGQGVLPNVDVPATAQMALTQQPVAPQAPVAPPAAQPALAPQQSPEEANAAAYTAAPSLSVSDVYNGQIGTAAATDGNYVSRDPFGITAVTNKYGVTTGMTPTGKQTAYGAGPSLDGLSSALGSVFSGIGANRNKMAGQVLGALAGGALLGPAGALAGGYFGGKMGAKNDYPSAPSRANDSSGVKGGDKTDRERSERSPSASRSISAGRAVSGLW